MENNLGEIFYEGRIIKLNFADNNELKTIYEEKLGNRAMAKEKVFSCLEEMKG